MNETNRHRQQAGSFESTRVAVGFTLNDVHVTDAVFALNVIIVTVR